MAHQMVFRFTPISLLMGSDVGPMDLLPTPDIRTSSSLHRSILWVYRPHALLQSKGLPFSSALGALAVLKSSFTGPQQHTNPILGYISTRMSGLVSCQLLPYGLKWFTYSHKLWSIESGSVDDGLSRHKLAKLFKFERCMTSQAYEFLDPQALQQLLLAY